MQARGAICQTQVCECILDFRRCRRRIRFLPVAYCLLAADAPKLEKSLTLQYRAEWRLMHAGDVTLKMDRKPKEGRTSGIAISS